MEELMGLFPLVALVSKRDSVKSLAVIEGLIMVPVIAALVGYLFAQTDFSLAIRMSFSFLVGFPLVVVYARFASS
jgi:uncharacterized protein YqgC (DUF456 family)